jgi:hypothetical protein
VLFENFFCLVGVHVHSCYLFLNKCTHVYVCGVRVSTSVIITNYVSDVSFWCDNIFFIVTPLFFFFRTVCMIACCCVTLSHLFFFFLLMVIY